MDTTDVIIVGGGPAGTAAAKLLARSRREVVLVDAGAPRNASSHAGHNVLYAEGASPGELARVAQEEARSYGVRVVDGRATGARLLEDPEPGAPRFAVEVRTSEGSALRVGARAVLLATSALDVLPDVEGLAERWGVDVLHCAFCHGFEVADQAVAVLGSGAISIHQVQLFRRLSDDVVYLQHTAPDPDEDQREQLAALGVEHVVGSVAAVETTDGALSAVRLADGRTIPRQALVVTTQAHAREDLLDDLGLELAELAMGEMVVGRHLPADAKGATATARVWAAGNVSAPMGQVAAAAAAGGAVAMAIHADLLGEDTTIAVATHRSRTAAGATA